MAEQREDGVSRRHSAGGRGTARPGAASRGDTSTAPAASSRQAAKPQQQPVVTSNAKGAYKKKMMLLKSIFYCRS